jgi:cell fate (sporulation/competence/biofilm development) regulator YmcA (YheA/YmcA/DUF963 family)
MTYALVTDIQSEFRKKTFDGSSDITDTRVQKFLDEADAEINLCLSNKYVTPITGIESLLIVKRIEIAIVAHRIASIIDLKQFSNQPATIKQEYNKKDFEKQARKHLQDLKNEITTLPDAELLSSDFGISSSLVDDCITPVFKKDVDQW